MDPLWSPDGRRILFASPVGVGAGGGQRRSDEAVVIEDFGYKSEGAGFFRPDSYIQLWSVDAASGETRQITDGPYHHMHHNWSADGKSVICASGRFRSREEDLAMDLLLIEDKTEGQIVRLTSDQWVVSYPNPVRPVMTPDGKSIIAGFLTAPTSIDGNYPDVYLYRVAADGSGKELIFQPDETCYQCVQFPYNASCGAGFDRLQLTEDGQSALFLSGWKGRTCLYKLDLYGDGRAVPLLQEKKAVGGIGKVRGGKLLAAMSEPDVPEYYCVFDLSTGETTKAAQSGADLLSQVAFSRPEDFSVETEDGDSQVHGWVLPPQNMEPGKKYPAILYIHGGPHPFYTYGFTHEYQCFAGAGYGVIYCNPRGSSGYGQNHQSKEKAFDGKAFHDLTQFTEEAVKRYDFIDGGRIGVTGGSYGGYMTNYIASHNKGFKAFISQRSVSSEVINYGSSDMRCSSKAFARFEDFLMDALERSPVSYAERVDRPFLILHGEDDLRTPVEGAHQLFTALKDLHPDLPVRMVIYPHTGHDQPNNPAQRRHYYNEMLQWFGAYL